MTYRKFYISSLALIILASAYPVYMGIAAVASYINNGFINANSYHKYVIPYTPICIALILSIAVLPVVFKLCKKYTLLVVSILGMAIFLITETCFEQIQVRIYDMVYQLQGWQLSLCMVTPQVQKNLGTPIFAQNNPAFKIHFYIIAIVIILAVINVIYGFSKMLKEKMYARKRPLMAQAISVAVFIALCIFACFTAFYRTGNIHISALSATLMSAFFIVFGITVGVYVGCIFFQKRRLLAVIVPAITAAMTTIVMYIGELILMGGVLFKFGSGFLFEPFAGSPFALVDVVVIALSGVVTYVIMHCIEKRPLEL